MSEERTITQELRTAITRTGWRIMSESPHEIAIENSSPAGEDLYYEIDLDGEVWDGDTQLSKDDIFRQELNRFRMSYDADEHALFWAARKLDSGEDLGIPDIRTLIEDADAIEEMLRELCWSVSLCVLRGEERNK